MHQVKSRHESRITNSKNSQRGATLSVVLCIIFVLVVIGIGLIFLIKLLGGGMEVRNANDAGILSVNKMAVKAPSVKLDTTNQFE